jgi:hypothetical protein
MGLRCNLSQATADPPRAPLLRPAGEADAPARRWARSMGLRCNLSQATADPPRAPLLRPAGEADAPARRWARSLGQRCGQFRAPAAAGRRGAALASAEGGRAGALATSPGNRPSSRPRPCPAAGVITRALQNPSFGERGGGESSGVTARGSGPSWSARFTTCKSRGWAIAPVVWRSGMNRVVDRV